MYISIWILLVGKWPIKLKANLNGNSNKKPQKMVAKLNYESLITAFGTKIAKKKTKTKAKE